jgi:ABC-type bacteriocin/lantibiotic exporter with double-glycine peptidase domain
MLSLCLSCASLTPRFARRTSERGTVLEVQHAHSKKHADCLAACVSMVLKYYGVETSVPDSVLPLDLATVTHALNTDTPVDSAGHVVFATILELGPEELTAQLAKKRPLIVAFKPSARKVYHSVVLSGYSSESSRFYVNDPARRKASWKKLSKIPTYADTGKYLVLLVGLREG